VEAHRFALLLGLLGVRCGELHGDLTQLQRLAALEQFRAGEVETYSSLCLPSFLFSNYILFFLKKNRKQLSLLVFFVHATQPHTHTHPL
jgi:hypothetical protein